MKNNLVPIKLALIELRDAIKDGDSLLTTAEKFLVLESKIEGFEKELREMCTLLGTDGECYVKRKEILGGAPEEKNKK